MRRLALVVPTTSLALVANRNSYTQGISPSNGPAASALHMLDANTRDIIIQSITVYPRTASLEKEEAEITVEFDGTLQSFQSAAKSAGDRVELTALGIKSSIKDILASLVRNYEILDIEKCDGTLTP